MWFFEYRWDCSPTRSFASSCACEASASASLFRRPGIRSALRLILSDLIGIELWVDVPKRRKESSLVPPQGKADMGRHDP